MNNEIKDIIDNATRDDVKKFLHKGGRVTVYKQPKVTGYKKIGRNEPCPCNSGKKYKNCCLI